MKQAEKSTTSGSSIPKLADHWGVVLKQSHVTGQLYAAGFKLCR
jgi:hypothetical protein